MHSDYHHSIQRMQQSIERLDRELARSRELLEHDLTIDNQSHQDLNFLIKVTQEDELNTLHNTQNRVCVPHQTTYRQRISTSPRERQPSPPNSNRYTETSQFHDPTCSPSDCQKNGNSWRDPSSNSIKVERKFQPFSSINKGIHYRPINTESVHKHHHLLTDSSIQTDEQYTQSKIPESGTERIRGQRSMNYPINVSPHRFDHTDSVPLPVLLSEPTNSSENYPSVTSSPQVINYLKQEYTKNHPELYTPLSQPETNRNNSHCSVHQMPNPQEEKQWRVQPLKMGYQNNKKYFQQTTEGEMLNKIKGKADQGKRRLKDSPSEGKSKGTSATPKSQKHQFLGQLDHSSSRKDKADDLFLQRKSLFITKLETKQKQQRRTHHKKDPSRDNHSISTNNLASTFKKTSSRSNSKEMSERVRNISQRLYSRSKEKLHPCSYHRRFGESMERERFYSMVGENSFVQKYLGREEQESLFQKLRRDEESVSSWPMKILNYTYSKLKKIDCSSRYTIRRVYE